MPVLARGARTAGGAKHQLPDGDSDPAFNPPGPTPHTIHNDPAGSFGGTSGNQERMVLNLPTQFLSAALLLGVLVSLAITARTWRLRYFSGRNGFVLLQLAIIWWSLAVACEHWSTQPDVKVFWAEMAWLGIISTPGAWALFIWNYIQGQYRPAPRALYPALIFVALATWLLALTNDHHRLLYASTVPVGTAPFMTIKYFHGPLYFVQGTFFYFVMTVVFVYILYYIINANHIFRKRYVWFAIGSTLPLALNMIHFLDVFPAVPVDLTPFSFIVMSAIFYWQISRRQLFDLLPIAHGMLLDAMPDPVLVLDSEQRIVECNPAAARLVENQPLVGLSLDAVPELRRSLSLPALPAAGNHEAAIGTPARYFDVGQVPLTYTGRGVGRLILLRDITHRKLAEDRLQSALAELEQHQRQLREEAIRDALTGLHNRRFLDELGPILLAEANRAGAPLAAVMLDIDHFKRLNDTHGHQAGDAILRACGEFLRQQVRQSDAVFRTGGEEFLVLLPHTQDAQVQIQLETLRTGFAALRVGHEGLDLSATVSAGYAMYPTDADNMRELLHRADLALYQAKAGGRDRVCRWRPDVAPAREGGADADRE